MLQIIVLLFSFWEEHTTKEHIMSTLHMLDINTVCASITILLQKHMR